MLSYKRIYPFRRPQNSKSGLVKAFAVCKLLSLCEPEATLSGPILLKFSPEWNLEHLF